MLSGQSGGRTSPGLGVIRPCTDSTAVSAQFVIVFGLGTLPATCESPLRAHGTVRCGLLTSTSGSPSAGHANSLILPPSLEHSRA